MQDDRILDNQTRLELPMSFSAGGGSAFGGNRPESFWKNKTVIFSTIATVIILGLIGWYFLFGNNGPEAPTSKNVVLLIKGPEQLVSGNEAEYRVIYRNGENADLTNITLEAFYPSGFTFKSATPQPTNSSGTSFNLPIVKEGSDGELVIRGKLTGATGEDKQIKTILHYRLSNFNSQFAYSQTIKTSILPPNLTMDVNGPVDVVQGQDMTFNVNFTNITSQDFNNLALQLTYPEGFIFSSSNPPASKNGNYWSIPKLGTNSSVSIEITGSFTGETAEIKLVKADLGQIINNSFAPQLTSSAIFRIIPSSLAIKLVSDVEGDVVRLGDTINFDLSYGNQGGIGLNNLIIVVKLEGPAVDLTRVSADDAIVSGNTLTWKAATLPGLSVLSPNERGEIRFTVPIKESLSTNLKNQTVKALASIVSDEISKPTKAADVSLKLGSQMELLVSGDYVSGAAPMQVGKTTLFAMTFLLSNSSNDISDTKVTASLPLPDSAWKNVIIPDSEKNRISYDPNSGRITWNIADLAAFSGRFTEALRVTFQLEVSPTEVDRNKVMNLLSNIQASGKDSFTGQQIQTDVINNISTGDIDDDVLNNKGTTVQ